MLPRACDDVYSRFDGSLKYQTRVSGPQRLVLTARVCRAIPYIWLVDMFKLPPLSALFDSKHCQRKVASQQLFDKVQTVVLSPPVVSFA